MFLPMYTILIPEDVEGEALPQFLLTKDMALVLGFDIIVVVWVGFLTGVGAI